MPTSHPNTAIILIDPYNEFLHPSGKLHHRIADSLATTDTTTHLKRLVDVAHSHKIPIFYAFYQQVREETYDAWHHMTEAQKGSRENKVFIEGSFGTGIYEGLEPDVGENRDVVVGRYWSWSSFENTDLEFQLRQRDISNFVIAGLEMSACVESTARVAYEREFHITMLTDATAAFTQAAKDATVQYVWPIFANKVTTVDE